MQTDSAVARRSSVAAATMPGLPPRPGLVRLPALLALLLYSPLLLPRVQQNEHLFATFLAVPTVLLAWFGVLRWLAARRGRPLAVDPLPPIKQHYVQASVQTCLYLFWGYLWVQDGVRPIYAQAPLILAQFAYLYAFDGLFAWSRGRPWRLGSGPTPIVLSTNLFIWFRDDWFVWQFAMVSAGLLGKEFVKWTKDGRRTHIFNPSGFGLACAATVLIVTGTTHLTWAKELATTIEVPGIYVFIFCLGMVVQAVFRVTLMTFAAVLVMVAINVAHTWLTGVYLFASSNLPAAAFLGLHLLMTDPSTSPRTNVGRTLFGAGYGLGYIVVFEVLSRIGAPELYAKLYPVPILNCCVQWLDRRAHTGWLRRVNARWEGVASPARTNMVHMGLWAAVFAVMLGTGYVYGLQRVPHPGDSLAFWKQAQAEGRYDASRKLTMVAGSQAVATQNAEAYNELGILSLAGEVDTADHETRVKSAAEWFGKAMARGSAAAHENVVMTFLYLGRHRSDEELARALQHVRNSAQRGGRAAQLFGLAAETAGGVPADPGLALQCYRLAGNDLSAQQGIARLALAPGSLIELGPVVPALQAAAARGDGESNYYLAHLYRAGRSVTADPAAARACFIRACELGFATAIAARDQHPTADVPPFVMPRRRHLTRPPWSTAFPANAAAGR